jgi:hypothetical protein
MKKFQTNSRQIKLDKKYWTNSRQILDKSNVKNANCAKLIFTTSLVVLIKIEE